MTTYYIDPLSGDDGNDGSTGAPWLTISHGLSACSNNDTLRLRSGMHSAGNMVSWKTGITLMADTGHTPIWHLAEVVTGFTKTGGATNVYQATALFGSAYAVWVSADKLTSTASVIACDALTDSYFFDNPNDLLYVNIGGGEPSAAYAVGWATSLLAINGTGWVVDGITLQYALLGLELSQNTLVKNCTVRYWHAQASDWNPFTVSGSGASFINCALAGASYPGAVIRCTATSSNVTVRNCTCTQGQWMVTFLGGSGHVVEDCVISGVSGDGVGVDGGSANVTIRRVTVRDYGHGGFWFNGNASGQVEHCIAYLTQDIGGGALYGFIADPDVSVNFYHCVAAHMVRSSSGNRAGFWVNTAGAVAIKNCIDYNNAIGIMVNTGCGATMDADYNCINSGYGEDADAGAHDFAIAPLFRVDAAGRDDFRLLPASPCIDAGTSVAGVNEGFRGGAPDVGAFEYVRPATRRR